MSAECEIHPNCTGFAWTPSNPSTCACTPAQTRQQSLQPLGWPWSNSTAHNYEYHWEITAGMQVTEKPRQFPGGGHLQQHSRNLPIYKWIWPLEPSIKAAASRLCFLSAMSWVSQLVQQADTMHLSMFCYSCSPKPPWPIAPAWSEPWGPAANPSWRTKKAHGVLNRVSFFNAVCWWEGVVRSVCIARARVVSASGGARRSWVYELVMQSIAWFPSCSYSPRKCWDAWPTGMT